MLPAPYAGTNRVRFNGFASSSDIRCPASQAFAKTTPRFMKCSLPQRMRAKLRHLGGEGCCAFFKSTHSRATRFTGNPATVRPRRGRSERCHLAGGRARVLACRGRIRVRRRIARITMCGCASSTRARKRRSSDMRPWPPTPCCWPWAGAAPGVCRQHSGTGIIEVNAQIEQRATAPRRVIEFRQSAPRTGRAAAVQDHAARRRSAASCRRLNCTKSCRRESRARAAAGCWCRSRITGISEHLRRTSTLCCRSARNWRPTASSCSQ